MLTLAKSELALQRQLQQASGNPLAPFLPRAQRLQAVLLTSTLAPQNAINTEDDFVLVHTPHPTQRPHSCCYLA